MIDEDIEAVLGQSVFRSHRPDTEEAPPRPAGGGINSRKHYRHPVRWRVAIVNKNGENKEIYHGRTHDLSLSGVSILIEQNVYFSSEVVLLLAIPPLHHGQRETIVEVQCHVMHTVLDSEHSQFRMGLKFIHFKGEGKKILSDVLSKRHIPKQENNPYGYSSKRG